MYPVEEFRDCLQQIVDIFGALGVRFHLTGGAAAVAYGDPRMTQDIDFVVDRDQLLSCLPSFFAATQSSRFLYDRDSVQQAVENGRQFQLFDVELALKMDFYPRELIAGELGRSVDLELFPGMTVPVASRADVATSKLIWISKGSHKSRRDLRQIMLRATPEERASIQNHAAKSSLSQLLDEVLKESDEISE